MPRIPGVESLPEARGNLAGRAVRVPEIEAPSAQLVQIGGEVGALSDRLREAAERIGRRRDLIEKAKVLGSLKQEVNDTKRAFMDTDDPTDRARLVEFQRTVDEVVNKHIAAFNGTDQGRAEIEAAGINFGFEVKDSVIAEGIEADKAIIDQSIETNLADIAARGVRGEMTLTEQIAAGDQVVSGHADALSIEGQISHSRTARELPVTTSRFVRRR
jgi:hypothetical protein